MRDGYELWKLSVWEWLPIVLGKVAKRAGGEKNVCYAQNFYRSQTTACESLTKGSLNSTHAILYLWLNCLSILIYYLCHVSTSPNILDSTLEAFSGYTYPDLTF